MHNIPTVSDVYKTWLITANRHHTLHSSRRVNKTYSIVEFNFILVDLRCVSVNNSSKLSILLFYRVSIDKTASYAFTIKRSTSLIQIQQSFVTINISKNDSITNDIGCDSHYIRTTCQR